VRRVPFSCFMLPNSFSTVPGVTCPVLMFCTLELIFGGTSGVGSRFHVLRVRTPFKRYRGRRVPFSYFDRPDSFSVVPRASGPVFIFCAPRLIFGGTEGVGSRIEDLRSRTYFRRCQVGSRFHVLRSRTCFGRYRGRRVQFSCFTLQDPFWAVSRATSPGFMFCAPGFVLGGTEGVGSRFHVLRSETHFRRYCGRRVLFWAPGPVLGGTKGVGSRFHILLSRTNFRRYRGRYVSFSCFAPPEIISGGTEGIGSRGVNGYGTDRVETFSLSYPC
jgi:hypothetical protein